MMSLLSSAYAWAKKAVTVVAKVCMALVQWVALDVLHVSQLAARLTAAVKG